MLSPFALPLRTAPSAAKGLRVNRAKHLLYPPLRAYKSRFFRFAQNDLLGALFRIGLLADHRCRQQSLGLGAGIRQQCVIELPADFRSVQAEHRAFTAEQHHDHIRLVLIARK